MFGFLKRKKDSVTAKLTRRRAKSRVKNSKKAKRVSKKDSRKLILPVNLLWENPVVLLLRDPRIGLTVLAFIVGLVLFPYVQSYSQFEPVKAEGDDKQTEAWDGSSRMIMLAIGKDVQSDKHQFVDALALIVVDPERSEMGLFMIHPDIDIFVPELGRNVTLRTMLNLQETEGQEVQSVVRAVEVLLAVKIDRYLETDEAGFAQFAAGFEPVAVDLGYDYKDEDIKGPNGSVLGWSKGAETVYQDEFVGFLSGDELGKEAQLARQTQFFTSLFANIDSLRTIINLPSILGRFQEHINTNLSREEVLLLGRQIWGLRRDQVKFGYTRSSSLLLKHDGSIYDRFTPVLDSIDKDISSILYNFGLAKEQARIEIYNGSGIRGMASSRARWLTNSGGRVVQVGNESDEEITKVYVNNPDRYPLTLHEIERVFDGEIIYADSPYDRKHIGDIIIVIGTSVAD